MPMVMCAFSRSAIATLATHPNFRALLREYHFAARSNDTLENHKTQLSRHMHQAKLVGVALVSEVVDGRRNALVED